MPLANSTYFRHSFQTLHDDLRVQVPWLTLDPAAEALVHAILVALFSCQGVLVVLSGFDDDAYVAGVKSIGEMISNVFEVAVGGIVCDQNTPPRYILQRWADLSKQDSQRPVRLFGQVLVLDGLYLLNTEAQQEMATALFEGDRVVQPSVPGKADKDRGESSAIPAHAIVAFTPHSTRMVHAMRDQFMIHVVVAPPLPSFPSPMIGAMSYALSRELLAEHQAAYQVATFHHSIRHYIRDIVVGLRNHSAVSCGINPHATLAMENTVRGVAVLAGCDYVTPSHVHTMLVPALAHRIVLATETRTLGQSPTTPRSPTTPGSPSSAMTPMGRGQHVSAMSNGAGGGNDDDQVVANPSLSVRDPAAFECADIVASVVATLRPPV